MSAPLDDLATSPETSSSLPLQERNSLLSAQTHLYVGDSRRAPSRGTHAATASTRSKAGGSSPAATKHRRCSGVPQCACTMGCGCRTAAKRSGAARIGKHVRFRPEHLEELIDASEQPATDAGAQPVLLQPPERGCSHPNGTVLSLRRCWAGRRCDSTAANPAVRYSCTLLREPAGHPTTSTSLCTRLSGGRTSKQPSPG